MEYSRGSEWRRWDLHVHTPCSILNNNFGNDFDYYVQQLFSKAVSNGIACIGITDYFSIEGYKKIRIEYLSNATKMEQLFPDPQLRREISQILLLPNVELRLNNYVGETTRSINYHVIFSDSVSIEEIEERFFGTISFPLLYSGGVNQQREHITKAGISRLGRHIKAHRNIDGEDYLVGLRNTTVAHEDVVAVITKEKCFIDRALLCCPADDYTSEISWNGRDSNTRRQYIQTANALFSSNPKTVQWALGELESCPEQEFISEFGKILPTFSSSDAHSFNEMFNNDEQRYCWIKADPTFNGLRQTLCEPKDRVRISATMPELKSPYHIISSVVIHDNSFDSTPIVFNDKLNCIIGGKSTGKSLLLHNIALSIDKKQTMDKTSITKPNLKAFQNIEVFWADETKSDLLNVNDDHKVVYIPQSYLNRLVDDKQRTTEIDNMIRDILYQNRTLREIESALATNISETKRNIDNKIYDMLNSFETFIKIQSDRKELGNSNGILEGIRLLEKQRQQIQKDLAVDNTLVEQFESISIELENEEAVLKKLRSSYETLKNDSKIEVIVPNIYDIDVADNLHFKELIIKETISFKEKVQQIVNDYLFYIENLIKESQDRYSILQGNKKALEAQVNISNSLIEIEARVENEKQKYSHVERLEFEETHLFKKINSDIELLSVEAYKFYQYHYDYTNEINKAIQSANIALTILVEQVFREVSFTEMIRMSFDNRTLPKFRQGLLWYFKEESFNIESLKVIISEIVFHHDDTLQIKGDISKEQVLRNLLSDWFNISYTVEEDQDGLKDMSPGKRALIMLKLLIGLAQSNSSQVQNCV